MAVTGPTGTFGLALMPLLQEDDRVDRVIGIARRPFDPAERGWTKMEYRRGDVRDADALRASFEGADVVVHLAFLIVGGGKETTRAINVEGTLNAFRAAAEAGREAVRVRLVDRGVRVPPRQPDRHRRGLGDPACGPALLRPGEGGARAPAGARRPPRHPGTALYLLRPPIVLGPDAVGAKVQHPGGARAAGAGRRRRRYGASPACLPWCPTCPSSSSTRTTWPRRCACASSAPAPPGAYNIAADDVVTGVDVARELGLRAVRVPGRPVAAAARAVAKLPFLPSAAQWVEAMSHPAIMDTTKAKTQLGWATAAHRDRVTAGDARPTLER